MILNTRLLGAVAALGCFAATHAITYSGMSSSDPVTWGTIGTDGLYAQVPTNFFSGVGSKTVKYSWTVTATPGMVLTSVKLAPNGVAINGGRVQTTALHPGDATATLDESNTAPLTPTITPLSGTKNSYLVTTTSVLSGTMPDSLAKVSILNVFYTEKAVPEPASLTALALGAALTLRRRVRS